MERLTTVAAESKKYTRKKDIPIRALSYCHHSLAGYVTSEQV